MRWARVTEGLITKVYRGQRLESGDLTIPDNLDIRPGTQREEYDKDWALKPLSQRVAKGLVTIDPSMMLVGEKLVRKPKAQLIQDGLIKTPRGQKLVGNDLVEMTPDEKLAAGLITDDQARDDNLVIFRQNRKTAYEEELDPIRNDIFRAYMNGDQATKVDLEDRYRAVDAEIRKRFPKP